MLLSSVRRLVPAVLLVGVLAGCSANLTPPGPVGGKNYYSTNAQVKTAGPDARCKARVPGARMVDGRPCPWPQ